MESQTRVSRRAPREFRTWRVQGNPPTLRQPCANPSPTLRQPFANLFCQTPLQPPLSVNPRHHFETLVNGFLARGFQKTSVRKSEMGRIRFRRVRFQTPNSVSLLALTEFRGENSVSSSQPIIVCKNELTEFFSQSLPILPQNSVSSLLRNSTLETVFRPFPRKPQAALIFHSLLLA